MIITVLEASVAQDRAPELVAAYRDGITNLEPGIVQTWLVQSVADPGVWRIQTAWRDREALQAMRTSGQTPKGVLFFRAVGAEPALSLWEVAASAAM